MRQFPGISFIRIFCFLCFFLAIGCAATGVQTTGPTSNIAEDQILRVGVCANAPPLIFKQDRNIVGLEAELAGALAAEMGKTLRFVELKWNDLIPALLEKRIDIIMSGMSVTNTRQVRIAFSGPYLTVGQMALVRGEDVSKYRGAYSIIFSKGTVGTEKGTTGDFLVRQKFSKARRVSFDSPERAVTALIKGNIDILIHDAPVVWWLASEKESKGVSPVPAFLTEEHLAWGLRYEDTELLEKTNAFLTSWRDNGRLRNVIKKWMPYVR